MKKVFITYDAADARIAREIGQHLRHSGLQTSLREWELKPMESISEKVANELAASDFLLVIVSQGSIHSHWIRDELIPFVSRELNERAITVIPVRIDDVDLPPELANRQYVDLRQDLHAGIQRLVTQVRSAPMVDWSRLSPATFEELVGELLTQLGFTIQRTPVNRDGGYDFVASLTAQDPFGTEKTETWLVEAKLYKESRVSVTSLRQLIGALHTHPRATKAVVLTNGQLTSAAREFLEDTRWPLKGDLRVVDGTALTSLITQHADLFARFFGATSKT